MYSVTTTIEEGWTIVTLREQATGSWVQLAPERGGMATSFGSHGRELLYMDKATFLDRAANVRGGNPVLFPISGQLPGGTYVWEGQTYTMKNHGFARDRIWEVAGTETEGSAAVTLRLTSDEQTRAVYPFDFELLFTYRLQAGRLTIEQRYRNASASAMPMYPGFHPYFLNETKRIPIQSDADRFYDHNDGGTYPFSGTIDMSDRNESVMLLGATDPACTFETGGGQSVRLQYGPEFRYVVIWTVAGKPFVCVEPWTAQNSEFLRGEELTMISPGDELVTSFSIESGSVTTE